MSLRDKHIMETIFTTTHGHAVLYLLQRLTAEAQIQSDCVAACKESVYYILGVMHTGRFNEISESYFVALAQSGLLTQAAHDAKWALPHYRINQVCSY